MHVVGMVADDDPDPEVAALMPLGEFDPPRLRVPPLEAPLLRREGDVDCTIAAGDYWYT
jgi:hypothetical protein